MKPLVLLFTISVFLHELNAESKYCSDRNACGFNEKRSIPICYCDNECFLYQDCCKEKYDSGGHEHIDVSNVSLPTSETCKILTNEKMQRSARIGAFMIDRCTQTNMLCEVETGKWNTMIPVSKGSKTYINANCALCNDVNEFKYWNIAFMLRDEMIKDLETGKITSDETILNEVGKGVQGDVYFLHPPDGITPRFCPFDVRMKGNILEEPLTYQNTYNCNKTWYKNRDECLKDDCCTNMFGTCITFYLGLLPSSDDTGRTDSVTTIHAIIEFNPQKTAEKSFLTMEDSSIQDTKLAFMDVQGYIIIEMVEVENGNLHVDDCIYAIMAFLRTTPFRLIVEAYQFSRTKLPGQEYQTIFFMYRSTTMLGLSEMNRLFDVQYYIQSEDPYGNVSSYAKVSTSNIHENEELFRSDVRHYRIMNANRYKVTPTTASESCGNFSLVIDKSTPWRIPVEARCMEEKPILNAVSRGYSNRRNVLDNLAYVAVGIAMKNMVSSF